MPPRIRCLLGDYGIRPLDVVEYGAKCDLSVCDMFRLLLWDGVFTVPEEVVPRRKIREVLRVCWACGWSERAAAISLSLSRSTVGKYLARARVAGLSWPLPEDLDHAVLKRRLFPSMPVLGPEDRFVSDWTQVNLELVRKEVTLQLLWKGYKRAHPEGHNFNRCSELYGTGRGKLDLFTRPLLSHRF